NRCCLRGRVHAFAWGPHPRWSHGRPQARAGLVHWVCCDERLLVLFPSALRGVPIGWRLLVLFPSALRGVSIGWRLLVLLPSALRGVPCSHNRCRLRGRVHAFAWGPHPRWSRGRQACAGLAIWLAWGDDTARALRSRVATSSLILRFPSA